MSTETNSYLKFAIVTSAYVPLLIFIDIHQMASPYCKWSIYASNDRKLKWLQSATFSKISRQNVMCSSQHSAVVHNATKCRENRLITFRRIQFTNKRADNRTLPQTITSFMYIRNRSSHLLYTWSVLQSKHIEQRTEQRI